MQLIQVVQGVLGDLAAGCAAKEEGSLGVLEWFGGSFVESAFAASVAGFSNWVRRVIQRAGRIRYIWRNIVMLWWEN